MSASYVSVDPQKVEVVMSWIGRSQSSRYAISWDWQDITGGTLRISHD